MLVVATLFPKMSESSLSLWGARQRAVLGEARGQDRGAVCEPGQRCGRGLPGACSPAHIGVQLDQVPPGAVQQHMKHHLDGNLAGRRGE